MKTNEFDGKLFCLLLLKKWKTVIIATLIGVIILGVPYILSKTVVGNFNYRSEVTVHVEYGEDSSGQMYDYINFYTWKDWIGSDKFIEYFRGFYPGNETDELLKSFLDADIEADQRVVTFIVTTKDPHNSDMIASTLKDCIEEFLLEIPEVKSAEVIDVTDACKYFVYDNKVQVCVLGALIGFFVSIFALWLTYLLDDSVYIPEKFAKESRLCEIKKEDEKSDNKVAKISVGRKFDKTKASLEEVVNSDAEEVILLIESGAHNGKAIGYVLGKLEKKKVMGFTLVNPDEKLIKAYYAGTNFPNPFMK